MRAHAAFAILLGLASGAPVLAQSGASPTPRRPGWLPPEVRLGGLPPAQHTAAIATLERIQRLLQGVPELAAPEGFEIQPVIGGGSRPIGPDQQVMPDAVVEYILTLMFYVPSKAVAGEGCGCIQIRVNPLPPGSRELYDAEGRAIYIENARARRPQGTPEQVAATLWEVPGATQVYGELWDVARDAWHGGVPQRSGVDVLFASAGDLPWRPVSRETFYAASLAAIEGRDGEKLAEFRAGLGRTPYQEWMAGAEERRKNREETLREAARYQPPAEVANLRRMLEQTEQEVTERLRATDAEDRVRHREALAASYGYRDSLAADLERMTPAERRMPTYINNVSAEGPLATGWTLGTDSTPPSWRVLTPNYDFWRARRSPVDVRSINVQIGIGGTGLHPQVRQALLQTFRLLDWAAVNQLLDVPR
jgi:hypothetical protein